MDFVQLRHFLAVAETLHFGRAARMLGLAQPHLSRSISRLEEEIGVRLFERTSRRVNLTVGGSVFQEEARDILLAEERLKSSTRHAMQIGKRKLRVSFVSAALYHVLPSMIRTLKSEDSSAEFELIEATTNEQIEFLSSGRVDIGLVHPPIEERPRLLSETLAVDGFDAVLPQDHALARHPTVSFEQLAAEPFVLFPEDQGPALFSAIRDQCRLAGHALKVATTAARLHSQISLVAAGLGVGLAPCQSRSLSIEGTVRLPIRPYPETLTLTLAALRDHRSRPPMVTDAIRVLREMAANAAS